MIVLRRLVCMLRGHRWDCTSLYVIPRTAVRKGQLISVADCEDASKKCMRCGKLKSVLPLIRDEESTCNVFPDIEWEPDA